MRSYRRPVTESSCHSFNSADANRSTLSRSGKIRTTSLLRLICVPGKQGTGVRIWSRSSISTVTLLGPSRLKVCDISGSSKVSVSARGSEPVGPPEVGKEAVLAQ